jgi:hypothetical protein
MEQGIFTLEILVSSFLSKWGLIFTPKNYLLSEKAILNIFSTDSVLNHIQAKVLYGLI